MQRSKKQEKQENLIKYLLNLV